MGKIAYGIFQVWLMAMLMFASTFAGAQDIESIRQRFTQNISGPLSKIDDLASVEEMATHLPNGRTLRQTVKIFLKGANMRYEVEAAMKSGDSLRFMTISLGDDVWTITPGGKKVKVDPSTHGGMRPEPLTAYLGLTIESGAKLAGPGTLEGVSALIVENPISGERIWLAADTMTPLKVETQRPLEGKAVWVFLNFRMVNGVAELPHDAIYRTDSSALYHHVKLVAVNAGLEDDLFDPDVAVGAPPKPEKEKGR